MFSGSVITLYTWLALSHYSPTSDFMAAWIPSVDTTPVACCDVVSQIFLAMALNPNPLNLWFRSRCDSRHMPQAPPPHSLKMAVLAQVLWDQLDIQTSLEIGIGHRFQSCTRKRLATCIINKPAVVLHAWNPGYFWVRDKMNVVVDYPWKSMSSMWKTKGQRNGPWLKG
jgi:hypothetical protein